jgi:hypothetical protein
MSIISYILDTIDIINNLVSEKEKTKLTKTEDDSQFLKVVRFPKRSENFKLKNYKNINTFKNINNIDEWNNSSEEWDLDTLQNYKSYKYKLYNLHENINSLFIKVTNLSKDFFYSTNLWFNGKVPRIDEYNEKTDPVFIQKVKIDNKNAKITILGDFHSSLHSLIDIISRLKEEEYFSDPNEMILKSDRYIFFLGDLVDRGAYGLELLLLAFILKKNNPKNVYIINGNHEDYEMYSKYGLTSEINNQFKNFDSWLPELMYLPSAIYLDFNGINYHLSHGAFDLEFSGFQKLESSADYNEDQNILKKFLNSTKEYALIKDYDPYNNYKWGDFSGNNTKELYIDNYTNRLQINNKVVEQYCNENNIRSMITGHQDFIDFGLTLPNKQLPNNKDHIIGYNYVNEKYEPYKYCNSGTYSGLFEIRPNNDCYNKNKINGDVVLKPGRDFIACITSTATIPRNIPQNTYLELDDNNKYREARSSRRGTLDQVIKQLEDHYNK